MPKLINKNIISQAFSVIAVGATSIVAPANFNNVKISVLSCVFISSGPNLLEFRSTTSNTTLFGPVDTSAQSGATLPYNEGGWFETNPGEGLEVFTSVGNRVGGVITYEFIQA